MTPLNTQNQEIRTFGLDWWGALGRALSSIEAVRDGHAWYLLLATFSATGLVSAVAQASLGRDEVVWAVAQGALALFIAFYGTNAAGLLMMDRALGRPPRDAIDALQDSLGVGHRVLVAVGVMLLAGGTVVAGLLGLFWLCSLAVIGPWLYAAVVPLTVLVLGVIMLTGVAVVGPLTGPMVWRGASSWQAIVQLWAFMRQHLLPATVLFAGLSLVTALLGLGVTVVVLLAGRLMAEASVVLVGVDVPPELLMAGLFGHGLHSVNLAVVPKSALPHTMAALVGGGVVFSLALVMPSLVYLRGVCEIYLSLAGRPGEPQGEPDDFMP
jgi:hypothetical protein